MTCTRFPYEGAKLAKSGRTCKLFFLAVAVGTMAAPAFATRTPFEVVTGRENNEPFRGLVKVFIRQAGNTAFFGRFLSHDFQVRIFTVYSKKQQPVRTNGFAVRGCARLKIR